MNKKGLRYAVELLDENYKFIARIVVPKELMAYRLERGLNSDGYLLHEYEDYKRTLVFGGNSNLAAGELEEGLGKLDIPFDDLKPYTVLSIDTKKYKRYERRINKRIRKEQ